MMQRDPIGKIGKKKITRNETPAINDWIIMKDNMKWKKNNENAKWIKNVQTDTCTNYKQPLKVP